MWWYLSKPFSQYKETVWNADVCWCVCVRQYIWTSYVVQGFIPLADKITAQILGRIVRFVCCLGVGIRPFYLFVQLCAFTKMCTHATFRFPGRIYFPIVHKTTLKAQTMALLFSLQILMAFVCPLKAPESMIPWDFFYRIVMLYLRTGRFFLFNMKKDCFFPRRGWDDWLA